VVGAGAEGDRSAADSSGRDWSSERSHATLLDLLFPLSTPGIATDVKRWYVTARITGACPMSLGFYLFFGRKWIVNLAIPSNRPYCAECGYDLSQTRSLRCPECGTPVPRGASDAASAGSAPP
jgi:hypothetical protein